MPDLRNGLLPLLPAPSSNHARGSAQKVGNSEPEEASRESIREERIKSILQRSGGLLCSTPESHILKYVKDLSISAA